MGERVPQSIQNLVLRDYCKRNGFIYELSTVEYCMHNSMSHLKSSKKYKYIFWDFILQFISITRKPKY